MTFLKMEKAFKPNFNSILFSIQPLKPHIFSDKLLSTSNYSNNPTTGIVKHNLSNSAIPTVYCIVIVKRNHCNLHPSSVYHGFIDQFD